MTPVGFGERLAAAVRERGSQIVLGLDPSPELMPGGPDEVVAACRRLIDRAGPACVAVKPQVAWFERMGATGWDALERVSAAAREAGLLVIADAKRGDIGRTAGAYAEALLRPPFDALTVNPMLGGDAVAPFVEAARSSGRGVFVLVRTSNPGAADLQDLELASGERWHERLAALVADWGAEGTGPSGLSDVGAVVGATEPRHIAGLRALMPAQPFLIPGVGAQGGRPEDLGPAFAAGPAGALVAASRSLMGAADPRAAAEELRDRVRAVAGG